MRVALSLMGSTLGSPTRKSMAAFLCFMPAFHCKWTIRSDRVQGSRTEALNLIRNARATSSELLSRVVYGGLTRRLVPPVDHP